MIVLRLVRTAPVLSKAGILAPQTEPWCRPLTPLLGGGSVAWGFQNSRVAAGVRPASVVASFMATG